MGRPGAAGAGRDGVGCRHWETARSPLCTRNDSEGILQAMASRGYSACTMRLVPNLARRILRRSARNPDARPGPRQARRGSDLDQPRPAGIQHGSRKPAWPLRRPPSPAVHRRRRRNRTPAPPPPAPRRGRPALPGRRSTRRHRRHPRAPIRHRHRGHLPPSARAHTHRPPRRNDDTVRHPTPEVAAAQPASMISHQAVFMRSSRSGRGRPRGRGAPCRWCRCR